MSDRGPAVGHSADAVLGGSQSLDELWLRCQQRLLSHVAHDLKSALNGVSVNVEVVRGRSEGPDRPASDVSRFASAAGTQLEIVIKMTTALLSIGRASRGASEVSPTVRQVVSLLEDTLRSDGATIELTVDGGVAGSTSAPLSAVRLALTEILLAAVANKGSVAVRVRPTSAPIVEVRSAGAIEVLPDIGRALAAAKIVVRTDGHGISILFPGPTEFPSEDA